MTTSAGTGIGDITVDQAVSWNSAHSLTLEADHDVIVNAAVANTGGANITLHADDKGTGLGTVTFGNSATVSTSGNVTILYNPSVNPAGSFVNTTSYVAPVENFGVHVAGGALDPYMLVNNVYDLQNMQNNLSGWYALGKDIDASDTATWNGGAGFVPIGSVYSFGGTLNGQGHLVNGLHVAIDGNGGLFGVILPRGKVTKVGLTNVDVSCQAFVAGDFCGAVAGINAGLISESYATGEVHTYGTTIYRGGYVSANGGLVGLNGLPGFDLPGQIVNSYANVEVSGLDFRPSSTGGMVGEGGSGLVSQSYSLGAVLGTGANRGGLVGCDVFCAVVSATINDSYWNVDTSGQTSSGGGIGLTKDQLTSGLPTGFDPIIWGSNPSINGGYPYLLWQVASTPTPTTFSPAVISPVPPPVNPPPVNPPPLNPPPVTPQPVTLPSVTPPPVNLPPVDHPPPRTSVLPGPFDLSGTAQSDAFKTASLDFGNAETPPGLATVSATQKLADSIWGAALQAAGGEIVAKYSAQGLIKDQTEQILVGLIAAAVPSNLLGDTRFMAYLQSYLTGAIEKEWKQRITANIVGRMILDQVVSITADLLSAGVGYGLETRFGLSPDSNEVILAQYAVKLAINTGYGGLNNGAVGAVAAAAQTSVSEIVDSVIKTEDVLSSDSSAFNATDKSTAQLRMLADQIQSSDPDRAAHLREVADAVDAETARIKADLNGDWTIRLLRFGGL